MKIKILYFSSIKDKLKKSSEELNVPQGISVNDLVLILKDRYPHIGDILDRTMIAVNEEYVSGDYTIQENDTVALIPPVSGG